MPIFEASVVFFRVCVARAALWRLGSRVSSSPSLVAAQQRARQRVGKRSVTRGLDVSISCTQSTADGPKPFSCTQTNGASCSSMCIVAIDSLDDGRQYRWIEAARHHIASAEAATQQTGQQRMGHRSAEGRETHTERVSSAGGAKLCVMDEQATQLATKLCPKKQKNTR